MENEGVNALYLSIISISKFAHGPVTETLGWIMGKLLKFPVQKLANTDNNVEHRKPITGYFPRCIFS